MRHTDIPPKSFSAKKLLCTIAVPCCSALLQCPVAVLYCSALLQCSVAVHNSSALLPCSVAAHYCSALWPCSVAVLCYSAPLSCSVAVLHSALSTPNVVDAPRTWQFSIYSAATTHAAVYPPQKRHTTQQLGKIFAMPSSRVGNHYVSLRIGVGQALSSGRTGPTLCAGLVVLRSSVAGKYTNCNRAWQAPGPRQDMLPT